MRFALVVCLLMVVAVGIVLAFSPVRAGWFAPFAFCGSPMFLIMAGIMVLGALACLVMRHRFCRTGSAPWRCRPSSKS